MPRMKLSVILVASVFLAAYAVYRHPYLIGAQANQPPHEAVSVASNGTASTPPDIIDGATHPELIPDSIAYRLFFLTVAEPVDATDAQKARQRAYLRSAGLQEEDVAPAADVLATFKTQYDELVAQYNQSVQAADEGGQNPDLATFLSELNQLVSSTHDALGTTLDPETMSRFEAHVQREKKNMKMTKEAQ